MTNKLAQIDKLKLKATLTPEEATKLSREAAFRSQLAASTSTHGKSRQPHDGEVKHDEEPHQQELEDAIPHTPQEGNMQDNLKDEYMHEDTNDDKEINVIDDQYEKVTIIVGSGAADTVGPKHIANKIPIMPTRASK